jgi:hypothetical protein
VLANAIGMAGFNARFLLVIPGHTACRAPTPQGNPWGSASAGLTLIAEARRRRARLACVRAEAAVRAG